MYPSRVARFFKLAQQGTKAQGTRLHVFPTDAFGGQFLVFWRMRRVQSSHGKKILQSGKKETRQVNVLSS